MGRPHEPEPVLTAVDGDRQRELFVAREADPDDAQGLGVDVLDLRVEIQRTDMPSPGVPDLASSRVPASSAMTTDTS